MSALEAKLFKKERYIEPSINAWMMECAASDISDFAFTIGEDGLRSLTLKAQHTKASPSQTSLRPQCSSSSFYHLGTTRSKKKDMTASDQVEDRGKEEAEELTVARKDREIAAMEKSLEKYNACERPSSAKKNPACPTISTSTAAFNLSTEYPDLYQKAVENTRSTPVPNGTFVSDWGDSLKQGEDPVWRAINMKSTYTAANEQLNVPKGSLYSDIVSQQGLNKWLVKQKTYYGELLTEEKGMEFEEKFKSASQEEKQRLISTLRTLSAVSRPDLDKSHSQAEHCWMVKTDDPELNAMMKEQTRVKTFGNPTKIVLTSDLPPLGQPFDLGADAAPKAPPPPQSSSFAFSMPKSLDDKEGDGAALMLGMLPLGRVAKTQRRPASAAAAVKVAAPDPKAFLTVSGGKAGLSSRPQTAKAAKEGAKALISTFKSQIPLQWAPGLSIPQSTNTAAFSKPKAFSQYGAYAIHDEFTAPYGATNPNTAVINLRKVIPVPEGMVQAISVQPEMGTIHRSSYTLPSQKEQARHLQDAIKANTHARAMSYVDDVPLDRQALATSFSKDWCGTSAASFTAPDAEASLGRMRADKRRAAEVRSTFNGKTSL